MISDPLHSVLVVTADPSFEFPTLNASPPFVVWRHSWIDELGTLDARVLVEELATNRPGVVCIATDVPEALALQVSHLIDELHPEIGVVLIREPTSELWRESARVGVRDIIRPDALETDLLPALQFALERGERLRSARTAPGDQSSPRGKIIVVLSPKGGSGKTMLASNLAVALATTQGGETVLVDLDCLFGDVAASLGMVPEHNVGQLATLPSVDSTTLKVFLTRHDQTGLYILAGSESPEEGEAVTDKLVVQILDMLSHDFAYVIVDTAAGLDERALAAIEQATDLVFLASMDVASIRNLVKEIGALDRLHMLTVKRHFVLNRADARAGLDVGDVESVVGMSVDGAVPSSVLVPISMNHGTAVVLSEPDSEVAKALTSFAERFLPAAGTSQATSADRRSRFSLWRRSA